MFIRLNLVPVSIRVIINCFRSNECQGITFRMWVDGVSFPLVVEIEIKEFNCWSRFRNAKNPKFYLPSTTVPLKSMRESERKRSRQMKTNGRALGIVSRLLPFRNKYFIRPPSIICPRNVPNKHFFRNVKVIKMMGLL